jgi:hypothetical protein
MEPIELPKFHETFNRASLQVKATYEVKQSDEDFFEGE